MSPLVIVALSVAGGIGAVVRLVFDGFLRSRITTSYPLGTTVINVTGSLLLGLVTGLALTHEMPLEWRLILGTGFLGGYTTFSTASFETVRLAQQGVTPQPSPTDSACSSLPFWRPARACGLAACPGDTNRIRVFLHRTSTELSTEQTTG